MKVLSLVHKVRTFEMTHYGIQIYLNLKSKRKKEVEREYKNYVNVCVRVRACVCSYMCVKNDILHVCVCVCAHACVCVCACVRVCVQRKVLLTSLCQNFVILLTSPQRTTVLIAPGLQDGHSRSQVAHELRQSELKSPLTMRCPGPHQVE